MYDLLQTKEQLELKIRKHWIVYVEDFFIHGIGGFVCIVIVHYVITVRGVLPVDSLLYSHVAMVLIMVMIIFWCSFFFAWTKNYFDVWYVTREHIVAVNQKELFEREEAFMELARIQDIFFEKQGILGTVLGYGTLRVQSAGTEQEFIIRNVAEVESSAHKIIALRDQAQGKQALASL